MANPFPILIAEDDLEDVFFYERSFRREDINHPLEFVRDGQEALDYLFRTGKYANYIARPLPGLILLDIKMPKLSGLQVLERLRKDDRFDCVPMLIVSSSILPRDHDMAIALGAQGFISKTVGFVGFVDRIRDITGFWRQAPRPIVRSQPVLSYSAI